MCRCNEIEVIIGSNVKRAIQGSFAIVARNDRTGATLYRCTTCNKFWTHKFPNLRGIIDRIPVLTKLKLQDNPDKHFVSIYDTAS